MARKRKGKPIHGWLIIDKPEGLSSSAVVGRVRRILDAEKAGHGGTLDPLATGILPIALGEATKTVSYVMDGAKTYRFTISFGSETATDDREGAVTETSNVRPGDAEIIAALPRFIGDIEQVPPKYSAVKVDGERAYKLARRDQAVEIKSRTVRIERFTLIACDGVSATFEAVTGKGAYIRALARDFARSLGALGHVSMLRRTQVGPFYEKAAISLEKLDELRHSAALSKHLLPIMTVLDDIPALAVTAVEAKRLAMGQGIPVLPVVRRSNIQGLGPDVTVVAADGDRPIALARIRGGEIRPIRVLNL